MQEKKKISTGWIIFGFLAGFWVGAILLAIRIFQEMKEDEAPANPAQTGARDVSYRVVDDRKTGSRTNESGATASGGTRADGTYSYTYVAPKSASATATDTDRSATAASPGKTYTAPRERSALDHAALAPGKGKGLRIAGGVLLTTGGIISAIVFLSMMMSGFQALWDALFTTAIVALCICAPGGILAAFGKRKQDRILRCRTYATIIGSRRRVNISELAGAIPVSEKKCCADLKWMLGMGLLKGMYLDASHHRICYSDAAEEPADRVRTAPQQAASAAKNAAGEPIFEEEMRIHRLNDAIREENISRKMDRLEQLTHQILYYVHQHPEKQDKLHQFRQYYLPKTFSILESYARMERMGVEGANISGAMKDVEEIMDKLVIGFEKQLDALFDSEAMDVTSDISVLENMMKLEGLSDLDPFGAHRKDDDLLSR